MPMSAQRRVAVAERHTQAVQLAASGLSYDVIAQRLGYTHRSAARKAVTGALQARTVEAVDELRELEVGRLDALQEGLWERALGGEQRAVDSVLRIITARVRLLGLDQFEDKRGLGGGRLVSMSWQPDSAELGSACETGKENRSEGSSLLSSPSV